MYNNQQGKILNYYDNGTYSVVTVQVEEQRIINNPTPDPSVPVIDLRRQTVSAQKPMIQKAPESGSYGRSYTKYVSSDGYDFGVSVTSDMDL